jgi:hypothetical protein
VPHLNPDRLIDVGVNAGPTAAEHTHLTACAPCRSEVAAIGHVADLVRAADSLLRDRPRRLPPAQGSSSRVA